MYSRHVFCTGTRGGSCFTHSHFWANVSKCSNTHLHIQSSFSTFWCSDYVTSKYMWATKTKIAAATPINNHPLGVFGYARDELEQSNGMFVCFISDLGGNIPSYQGKISIWGIAQGSTSSSFKARFVYPFIHSKLKTCVTNWKNAFNKKITEWKNTTATLINDHLFYGALNISYHFY